jgi:hypothetical protein
MMADNFTSPMDDDYPNLKITDSNEVRKKQPAHLATRQRYSDLGSEVRDTPHSESTSGTPIYSNNNIPTTENKIQSKLLVPGAVYTTPTKFTPFKPMDLFPQSHIAGDRIEEGPFPKIGETLSTISQETVPIVRASDVGTKTYSPLRIIPSNLVNSPISSIPIQPTPPRPIRAGASPARKLQEVFHEEGERLDGEERISTLVHSIEVEMQRSGVRVDCTELKTQLNRLRAKDITPHDPSSSSTTRDCLKEGFHFPSASPFSAIYPTAQHYG